MQTQSGSSSHSSIFSPVRQMQQRCLEHKKALEKKPGIGQEKQPRVRTGSVLCRGVNSAKMGTLQRFNHYDHVSCAKMRALQRNELCKRGVSTQICDSANV